MWLIRESSQKFWLDHGNFGKAKKPQAVTPGAKSLNSVDCRVPNFREHPKSLIHHLASIASALGRIAGVQLAAARLCNVLFCKNFLLIVCHIRHLMSGAFTGCKWDTAQNFAVRTGVSHPKGLVLIVKFLVVPSKKPGEERSTSQWRAASPLEPPKKPPVKRVKQVKLIDDVVSCAESIL